FHLAVDAYNEEAVARLRARRRKPQKPFAVMSQSIGEVKKYAVISKLEEELLRSRAAPIVILDKREPFPLADSVSPGLHNVGVMLPYAGVHYVLFEHMKAGTVVMTSANEPDEPMIIDNDRALRELGKFCDYVLLHNREIHMRCDDSVIRVVDGVPVPIRRSRGYTPEPVPVPFPFEVAGAAVGGEFMVTAGVAKMGRAFLSQHIGEVESPESVEFLGEALRHLLKILRVGDLDFVAVDMHPMFRSRRVAREVAAEFGAEVVEVQHHHAHMAALMVESGVADEEIVAIACDGVGYGTDGLPWGGEVLLGGYGGFKRVGSLEPQPMPGGDACAVWYGRMAEGVLFSVEEPRELTEFLIKRCVAGFKRGAREVNVVLQQLEKNVNTVLTT
ncbi:TPA: carbamoyltransferase HypF, partial [Candidatus Micrarchaeota archaeon]|nr:carbamoyltransferase HypF [Candidatus Micrarchaeota archaeon]